MASVGHASIARTVAPQPQRGPPAASAARPRSRPRFAMMDAFAATKFVW